MQKKHYIFGLVFLVCIAVLVILRQSEVLSGFEGEALKNTVLEFGPLAPIVYMLFYAVASLLFIPGSPITLAGGVLFGQLFGTIYTVVGATIGALLAFTLSRTLGRKFVSFGTSTVSQRLQSYDERIAHHGFITVLFLRFVPLFPFNGLNFALGLTKVSYKDYFFGTFLGIIPGTFAYVYFGDSVTTLNPYKIGSAMVLVVVLSLLGKYFLRRYDNNHKDIV